MNNRLIERDILGVVAILLVVLQHASQAFVSWTLLWGINSKLLAAGIALSSGFTMPLFIMLAGLLLQFSLSHGKYSYAHDFLDKKVKRLLLPFLFFSPFMIYFFPINGYSFSTIFKLFISGAHHLWFIVTLLYAYLFFYFFKDRLNTSPLISLLILTIIAVAGRYLNIQYGGLYGLSNIMMYFVYFYIGMQIWKNYTSRFLHFNHWIFLGLYLAIRIVHMLYFRFDEYLFANSLLPVIEGMVGALWAWRFGFVYGRKIMEKAHHPIHFLSRNAYGIYLFHLPIIYAITEIFRTVKPFNIYCVVLIQFAVSLLLSVLLTEGFRKIKQLKIFIGE